MFNQQVVFTTGSTTSQTASAQIVNDMIALEENEVVNLEIVIESPTSGVSLGYFPTTEVVIVDDECKRNTRPSKVIGYFIHI